MICVSAEGFLASFFSKESVHYGYKLNGDQMSALSTGGESGVNFHDEAESIIGAYEELELVPESAHDLLIDQTVTELARLAEAAAGLDYEPYVVPSAVTKEDFWKLLSVFTNNSQMAALVSERIWRAYTRDQLTKPATAVKPFVSGMVRSGQSANHPDMFAIAQTESARKNAIYSSVRQLEYGRGERVHIEPLDPAAWLALNAIRRFNGEPMLDGFTIFDLPAQSDGEEFHEPYAAIMGDNVRLGGLSSWDVNLGRLSDVDNVMWHTGTRLAVTRKLTSESMPAVIPRHVGQFDADVRLDEREHQIA